MRNLDLSALSVALILSTVKPLMSGFIFATGAAILTLSPAQAQRADGIQFTSKSCASAFLEFTKTKQSDSVKQGLREYLAKSCKSLWEMLGRNDGEYYRLSDVAFQHSDVELDMKTPRTNPTNLRSDNIYEYTGYLFPYMELISINSYLQDCGSARHSRLVNAFRENESSGELASIAARQCQNNSYLRLLAESYSRAVGMQLRSELEEELPALAKAKESYEDWSNASVNARTSDGKDGVTVLAQQCKDYQANPRPSAVDNFISNSGELYKGVPEIRNNLISLAEAKDMMAPFWRNVKSCKFAVQSLKEKNKKAAQQSMNQQSLPKSRQTSSSWMHFRPTATNLEKMCISAANMSLGQNVRFQYVLMGARMSGLSAENQLAITRYMRASCPEYLR